MKIKHVIYTVIFVVSVSACASNNEKSKENLNEWIIPSPFAIAIDDLGWMNGGSLAHENGPYRVGFKREIERSDYEAIVEVAENVGVRMQGLFILSEMDRENVVASLPTASAYGEDWDNSKNISDEQVRIMDYVKEQAAYMEFGLHGVGHEFWVDGVANRAEWYSTDDNHPREEKDIRNHLEVFKAIMGQYGLSEENGHSFPESFVPCAYSYYWNPDKTPYSLGAILNEYGVKYANTLFSYIPELNPPAATTGGFDNGVLVIDRYNHGNPWSEPASLPSDKIEDFGTDVIETHFANWLATDDFLQPGVNEKWIRFFKDVQKFPTKYLAKNTEQFNSQWILSRYASLRSTGSGKYIIDTNDVPSWAYEGGFVTNLVLKAPISDGQYIAKALVNGAHVPATLIDEGYAMIYLPVLEKGIHSLEVEFGRSWPNGMVVNDGTYNVYNAHVGEMNAEYHIKVYGKQTIRIVYDKAPLEVKSSNAKLTVTDWSYEKIKGEILIDVKAHDIQGEESFLTIIF